MTLHTTREAWLQHAIRELGPVLASCCPPAPARIHVSVGFPKGARGGRGRAIGQCWAGEQSVDGNPHVFISPELIDPVTVLATLLHEQIHAVVGCQHGHKGLFSRAARACGLQKPWTATTPSVELLARLNVIAVKLGEYPHSGLQVKTRPKPGSRLRLWVCGCPVKVRVASNEFNATCGECEQPFYMAHKPGAGDE